MKKIILILLFLPLLSFATPPTVGMTWAEMVAFHDYPDSELQIERDTKIFNYGPTLVLVYSIRQDIITHQFNILRKKDFRKIGHFEGVRYMDNGRIGYTINNTTNDNIYYLHFYLICQTPD